MFNYLFEVYQLMMKFFFAATNFKLHSFISARQFYFSKYLLQPEEPTPFPQQDILVIFYL